MNATRLFTKKHDLIDSPIKYSFFLQKWPSTNKTYDNESK
jgi:hypothetical protein